MHWYLGMLISKCAAIRHDMCRPQQERERNHVDACAYLGLLKGMLEGYHKKGYDNGFADHSMGRYVLGMIIDDLQEAITTTLERVVHDCRIEIVEVDDPLDADHLSRVIRNRLSMLTYQTVLGEHIMCSNWVINNIVATKKPNSDSSSVCVEAKFCSGGHECFKAEFRHINDMWVCVEDLVARYTSDLSDMGCEVAILDS